MNENGLSFITNVKRYPFMSKPHMTDHLLKNQGILSKPDAVDACVRIFTEKGYRFPQTAKAWSWESKEKDGQNS